MMTFKDLKIEIIIRALTEAYNNENKSFELFRYNEIKYVLLSHLDTTKNISRIGREQIIESFLNRFRKEPINEQNFEYFFQQAKKNYFNRREVDYTLITSLSITNLPYRVIRINNSVIRIHGKNFPKNFAKNRKLILSRSGNEEVKNKFVKISVQLKGKSFYDAFEEAYFDLNIFRAILCLNMNSYSEVPVAHDIHRAINKVKFGEFHTLHPTDLGKDIDDDSYWFETNIDKNSVVFPNEKKRNINYWLRNFNNCSQEHKKKLGDVFNLYVNAFDEKDKQACFLKSWVALEALLGTYENKLIVKRCCSIFKKEDREFQNEILKGLKIQRNRIVHENEDRINSIVNCYHIQRYIKSIIFYNNLKYSKIINNNDEALKLLDYRLQTEHNLASEIKVLSAIKKRQIYKS